MIHLITDLNDMHTACGIPLAMDGYSTETTRLLQRTDCMECIDAWQELNPSPTEEDENAAAIDVKATPYVYGNSTITTPADIIGNYLLGRRIAKGGAVGRVIDYHTPPQSRQSIVLVLDTHRTVILYLPTKIEVAQDEIDYSNTNLVILHPEQVEHEQKIGPFKLDAATVFIAVFAVIAAVIGLYAIAT